MTKNEYEIFIKDPRPNKNFVNIVKFLKAKVVNGVKNNFKTVDTFYVFLQKMTILANKAKHMKLNKQDAAELSVMRFKYNSVFGVEAEQIRKFNKQFKIRIGEEVKTVRIPMDVLERVLQTKGFQIINSGKNMNKNYHWTKKYMPKDKETLISWFKETN